MSRSIYKDVKDVMDKTDDDKISSFKCMFNTKATRYCFLLAQTTKLSFSFKFLV